MNQSDRKREEAKMKFRERERERENYCASIYLYADIMF